MRTLDLRAACTLIVLGCLESSLAPAQQPTQSQPAAAAGPADPNFWRTARCCGANSLFLLMRARDIDIPYETVLAATPIGEKGSSLRDLRDAANKLGVPIRLGKGSPDALAKTAMPVIAHLDARSGNTAAAGHYVLVTAVDMPRRLLRVFDGASLLNSEMSLENFQSSWSGYVIELPPPTPWAWLMVTSLIAAAGAWGISRLRQRPARSRRGVTSMRQPVHDSPAPAKQLA